MTYNDKAKQPRLVEVQNGKLENVFFLEFKPPQIPLLPIIYQVLWSIHDCSPRLMHFLWQLTSPAHNIDGVPQFGGNTDYY